MDNQSSSTPAPVITGPFYAGFLDKKYPVSQDPVYGPDERDAIEGTVRSLLALQTSSKSPVILLGKIQSGKTKTFQGVIALAFDNGFDIAVIVTKPTTALTRQTYKRVKKDFGDFIDADLAKAYDILELPAKLSQFELNQKLIFILKKQTNNLERLRDALINDYPALKDKRILIIDDEADHASIGYSVSKTGELELKKIAEMIDGLRQELPHASFLQVTATPYSLYLQPEDSPIPDAGVLPVRPEATQLVPVHKNYIGGEYYFEKNKDPQSPAFYMFAAIKGDELEILKEPDGRRFKLEDCLSSPRVAGLRAAIVAFLTGGMIRRWQDENSGQKVKRPKRFAFLFHTEQSRASHSWQEQVVTAIYEALKQEAATGSELLKTLVRTAYADLERSIKVGGQAVPDFDTVFDRVKTALNQDQVTVTKVNSEAQVASLLDDDGQLGLRTPLNIFIGGQILDRGITIANLIGFYYGRSPQRFQQDTVLQHSRMYGFREAADCAVTRFHTAPHIYSVMRRMHDADEALRERILKEGDERAVKFIELDDNGIIVPCSRSKILASNIMTIKAHSRVLPYGFKTVAKTNLKPITEAIDEKLIAVFGALPAFKETPAPKEVDLAESLALLELINSSFKEFEPGYEDTWDVSEYKAVLKFLSESATQKANQGKVFLLVRTGRQTARVLPSGKFADSPDTGEGETRIAKLTASDLPVLILIKQEGLASKGWSDGPFWWPVIITPAVTHTTLFARAK